LLALLMGWLERRGPIAAGVAHEGLAARAEPLTRAFGLPIGALRTAGSLLAMGAGKFNGGGRDDVAPDRRAA
jgi:hypothetical protein